MTPRTGTMTNEQRLQKTIRLEKTDKILSAPSIVEFAANYTGITQKDFLDPEKAEAAFERTFNELGGWDLLLRPPSAGGSKPLALRTLLPGRELPDNVAMQVLEEEVMLPEDYDFVIENGFNALHQQLLKRSNRDRPEDCQQNTAESNERAKANTDKWLARGVAILIRGANAPHPFEYFSFHRSMAKFSLDVHRTPEKVKAAIKACIPDLIANAKKDTEITGCQRAVFTNSRGSPVFINAKQFEELVLPVWLEFTNAMIEAGFDVVFHCDTNWTRFLPYFKEFSKGKCLLELDGATDIFKAKEVLRDHMAVMGDVPATLLSMGTPEEVTAYCKKLIKIVGEGGGFILSSGCTTPYDAKIENVRAMVKAGNELTWY
jgi:hypothetical protein